MQFDHDSRRLGYSGGGLAGRAQSVLAKVLAVAATAVLLVSAIAVSIVVFAVALTAVLVFGGYVWWRTRELRRQLREQQRRSQPIEGEVIRDVSPRRNGNGNEHRTHG
jgi:membrane protein implicated in regulation of membrane protease activity